MALTIDDKNSILVLCGRGYSVRKIHDATGHSDTTISKVIKEAGEEVLKLKVTIPEAKQIAERTGYPLAFIDSVLKKSEGKPKEKANTETESGDEVGDEVNQDIASKELDFRAELANFQENQEIGQRKEKLRLEVVDLIDDLEYMQTEVREEGIVDAAYRNRLKAVKEELAGFVLKKLDEVDDTKGISDLEGIFKEINEKMVALREEHLSKIEKARPIRKVREKNLSDKLLDKEINVQGFPEVIQKQVKKQFLVRCGKEASMVGDALCWMAILIERDSKSDPKVAVKMWQTFTETIRVLGWQYMVGMAVNYRKYTKIP